MADLVAAIRGAIEAARAARAMTRADFVLSAEGIAVFPHTEGPGHPQYLSSLTPGPGQRSELTGLDAGSAVPVPCRPQNCDCGASQVAMVACWERCAARR